jgi:hypothetical protein
MVHHLAYKIRKHFEENKNQRCCGSEVSPLAEATSLDLKHADLVKSPQRFAYKSGVHWERSVGEQVLY